MKNLRKWFEKTAAKAPTAKRRVSDAVVKKVAADALKKYEKTFVDLARYDRGEAIRPLSK